MGKLSRQRREAIALADRIRLKRIEEMNASKGKLVSKGWWGGVIALLPVLDNVLVGSGVLGAPIIVDAASELMTTFGVLLGLWGRVKADKKIVGWL